VKTRVEDDDVDVVMATRIGDPVLRIVENKLTYPEDDVFLRANIPPPMPTAPPIIKITIM
jgi:hypothetical protein